ncbi:hypothetical protein MKEN_00609200 [Mycena kentingensis (nom. inval.)]|nr:hypothetical protein MKEN_00609200 [Mycena kentingensis (nom. inval.)]
MEAARTLWVAASLPASALSRLSLPASDNAVNSSFMLASAAQSAIGLAGLSAAHLHFLRSGVEQHVSVDARHAVLEFHSEVFYTLDGQPPGRVWDTIAGLYKTRDGGHVRIHTNFPHHRRGILTLLSLPDTPTTSRADVKTALLQYDAIPFETQAATAGMCATALRSYTSWNEHPHAKALQGVPPVQIVKIGDAPRRVAVGGKRPLDGIRVLDLSRVLAGPIAGRTLAAHGADVLLVTSPSLPALPTLDVDTSRGKRTTQLDLTLPEDQATLRTLTSDADVFLQAYRPGGLESKGFGPEELAKLRPGIICANLRAWGWEGPWRDRRGFDSLVQTATGFNVSEAEAFSQYNGSVGDLEPKPLPIQALDHAAAYLLAFGVNAALCKTITDGGSYEVRVSLAAVGQWIRSLGTRSPEDAFGPDARPLAAQNDEEIQRLSCDWSSPASDGRKLRALRHAAVLSATPVKLGEAPLMLDVHRPEWL